MEKDTQTSLMRVMSKFGHFSFIKENSVIIRITTDSSNKLLIAKYMIGLIAPKGDDISEAERPRSIWRAVDMLSKTLGLRPRYDRGSVSQTQRADPPLPVTVYQALYTH